MRYSPMFQKFARWAIYISYNIIYRFDVIGRENIPDGGCFVCANHPSLNDPVLVLVSLGTKYELSSMGKKELFDNKPLGALLTALGGFPVDRGKPDIKAIKMCLKDVKDGKKFILFPEGTRTENSGKKAKAGIGMLAIKAECPIVPIYIANSPKWFGKVKIIIGQPIIPPKRAERVSNEEFSQYILDHIFEIGEKNEG